MAMPPPIQRRCDHRYQMEETVILTARNFAARRAICLVAMVLLSAAARAQFGDVQHVTLDVSAPAEVKAGEKFTLKVIAKVAPGFHIQSNRPAPNFIPTVVKVSAPNGFVVGEPVFPQATMERAAGETIPVFSGTITVTVPVTAPAKATNSGKLTVRMSYQACDAGSCFPPAEAEKSVTLQVAAKESTATGTQPQSDSQKTEPPTDLETPDRTSQQSTSTESSNGRETLPRQPDTQTRPQESSKPTSGDRSPFPGYEMAKITQFVGPEEFTRFLQGGSSGSGAEAGRIEKLLTGGNLLVALPLIFLLGLALNLTPCVYPLIPITVSYFVSQTRFDGKKPIGLAVVYVLGMAVTYSVLGVAAGLTGGLFGAQLQNPWVLLTFALLMFALALSQFDRKDGRPIWELQLPAALRNRAQSRQGILGAALMGVMVGVVAAPCIGPAVVALLQWVSLQQSPVLGFAVFFTLALGLGLPYLFLAAASGSVQTLPRSGEWMVGVKHLFGMVLLWMGFYYLQVPLLALHPTAPRIVMVVVTAAIAIYLLFLERSGSAVRWFAILKKAVGLAAIALAVWLAAPAPAEQIRWQPYSESALREAMVRRKPILVDFTASWCAACQELEHKTFSDGRVGAAARDYVALRADMTNFRGSQAKEWQRLYGIRGLPTVVRLTPR